MTLILDPSTIPESTFRAMGRELQMELEEILASVAERGAPKDPLGVVTATDLLKSAIALGKATDGAPLPLAAAVVNIQYETLVAAIDLIKTHFGLPTVPKGH